jgi:hypothetical protein
VAGLNLRAGLGAGASASTGGGLMPVPAQTPTGPRASTAAAYGLGGGIAPGARTAALGGGLAGAVSALLLLWLWYSLPR